MKARLATGVAALLCMNVMCTTPANAVTYLYEINAFDEDRPPDATNSVTGSFTTDNSIGPASIAHIDIHGTLPTIAGSINFSFDQVMNPVETWNAFGGTSPYLVYQFCLLCRQHLFLDGCQIRHEL